MNHIAILVNDIDMFKVVIDNLPEESNQYSFILFNETRIGDKTTQIRDIAHGKIKYRLFTDKDVNSKLKDLVDTKFVDSYSMSLNILMLWFCFKYCKSIDRLLILDDDVIIRKDVSFLFDDKCKFMPDNMAGMSMSFAIKNKNKKAISLLNEFNRIFGVDVDPEELRKSYLNGGTKYFVRSCIDLDDYEKRLIAFFENEYIFEVWENRRSFRTAFLDERFEQLIVMSNGIVDKSLNKHVVLLNQKPDKVDFDRLAKSKKEMIHVCNHSWKQESVDRLRKRGGVK